jgi:hypothetical protein
MRPRATASFNRTAAATTCSSTSRSLKRAATPGRGAKVSFEVVAAVAGRARRTCASGESAVRVFYDHDRALRDLRDSWLSTCLNGG